MNSYKGDKSNKTKCIKMFENSWFKIKYKHLMKLKPKPKKNKLKY